VATCVTFVGIWSTNVTQVRAAAADTKRPAYSHLLINAQEYSLFPSRATVPAGTVAVELWNRGEDPHDTEIRRLNLHGQMVGPVLGRVKVTAPGRIGNATWHLKAGKYELFCSLPGHLKLGMSARLRVIR
jgi:cupredoxin-like protein